MNRILTLFLALGAPLIPGATVLAQDVKANDAFLLIATAALNNSSYRRTVILSVPIEGDRHVGIIVNRPSMRTLAELFPEHEPSKQVTEPVFFGGPMSERAIFALVRRAETPGRGALRLMDGLFLAITASAVDSIIEQTPQQARFYVGDVIWRPGELKDELGDGYWHVMDANPDLLFRKDTRALWGELSRLARSPRADAGHRVAPPRPG